MSDNNKVNDDARKKEILEELLNNMNNNNIDDNKEKYTDVIIDSEQDSIDSADNKDKNDYDNITDIENEEYTETEYDDEDEKVYTKSSAGKVIFGVVLTTVIISVAVLAAVFILKTTKEILGIGRSKTQLVIEIPNNSGTAAIANILYENKIISDTNLFRAFSKFKGSDGTFIAGAHKLNMNMSYADIIKELQSEAINEREVADVTFPEGISLYEAAKILDEKKVCDADKFIEEFNSASFGFDFEKYVVIDSMKFYKMEGYCFPDTYRFYVDEDPEVVVKKIYKNFNSKITPDIYGRLDDLDMTLEELLNLASIVQAEAPDKFNMRLVASVYLNRLKNPEEYPKLQSCPTRDYVNDIIIPNIEVPCKEMYEKYNTYECSGLPVGPICNPGLEAIDAVLYPVDSEYYFFCSNLETGEFFYAKTYKEHEENMKLANLV